MIIIETKLLQPDKDKILRPVIVPLPLIDLLSIRPCSVGFEAIGKISAADNTKKLKKITIGGKDFWSIRRTQYIYQVSYVLKLLGFLLIEKDKYGVVPSGDETLISPVITKNINLVEEIFTSIQPTLRGPYGTESLISFSSAKCFSLPWKKSFLLDPVAQLEPILSTKREFIKSIETSARGKLLTEGLDSPLLVLETDGFLSQSSVAKLTLEQSAAVWMKVIGGALFDPSAVPLSARVRTATDVKQKFILARFLNIYEDWSIDCN